MPQLIKPNDLKISTKEGEVKISITLDLNINLNDNKIQINNLGINNIDQKSSQAEEKVKWEIPDFSPGEKINFGK